MSARILLVGWHTATGLGTQNRDLAIHLRVARWLVPEHPKVATLDRPERYGGEYLRRAWRNGRGFDRAWARGMDLVLFAERPYWHDMLERIDVPAACYVNLEWLPKGGWPRVHLLAPTAHCHRALRDEGLDTTYVPMGVDTERFPFRQRRRAERFLYVHGWGGHAGRKAGAVVAEALRISAVPAVVYSQAGGLNLPSCAVARGSAYDPPDLYRDGDVLLQPSRFEGVGLPLLEASSSGIPLITTAAPPMDEYAPWRTIPAARSTVLAARPTIAYDTDPADVAAALRAAHGCDISAQSAAARRFAETRSWKLVAPFLRSVLESIA